MKKTFVSIVLLLSCSLFVSAADIYVNNSGQSGTFTTISSALAAAAPNDNIYISPYGAYSENLTIYQNVTLASAVSGTSFNVIGSLTINGAPNMEVKVVGGEFSGNCTVSAVGATLFNKSDVYLIDSKFNQITGGDFIRMHVLFCDMGIGSSTIGIRHGEVRGCYVRNISVYDGPNVGVGDTVFIVGNVCGNINWQNNDNYFFIANNHVYRPSFTYSANGSCLTVGRWHNSGVVENHIDNNTFSNNSSTANATIMLGNSPSNSSSPYNIVAHNNIIENRSTSTSSTGVLAISRTGSSVYITLDYNYLKSNYNQGYLNRVGNIFVNYLEADLTLAADGSCIDTMYCVDKGLPALQFYDIDMTRNDLGTFGGPKSIDNYRVSGTGNARIYDLDIPFEIWPGQTPQVNAKAAHTK